MDYQTIKRMAAEEGIKVTDLLAMAPANDPFYVGSKGQVGKAQWFKKLWDEAGYSSNKRHLRRFHYWLFTLSKQLPDGSTYINDEKEKCWDFSNAASLCARYLGLVGFGEIVDKKSPQPIINADYSDFPMADIEIPELNEPTVSVSGISGSHLQAYHLEVWVEKSTMNDVLEPVCRRYGANLITFEGEATTTAICDGLFNRVLDAGKPTRIFYISDFDPAGNSIPHSTARRIEWVVRDYNNKNYGTLLDVKLKQIALTAEQVETLNIPRVPLKSTDRRLLTFESSFGEGGAELDALEAIYPGKLAEIVVENLSIYYNEDVVEEAEDAEREAEENIKSQIQEVVKKNQKEIAALNKMQDELREINTDVSDFHIEPAELIDSEPDDWLYDSGRDYLEQLKHYKKFRGRL